MKSIQHFHRAGIAIAFAVLALGSVTAQAQNLSASGYVSGQARSAGNAYPATVVYADIADLDKSSTAPPKSIGTGLGGLIGGLFGHTTGGGNGKIAMTAVGAIGGAVIGNAAETAMSAPKRTKSQRIVVKLDNTKDSEGRTIDGKTFSLAQEVDGVAIVAGQKVFLLDNGGVQRVIPAQ